MTNASVRGDGHGADQHNIQTEQSRGLLDSTSSDASEHSDVAVVVPDEVRNTSMQSTQNRQQMCFLLDSNDLMKLDQTTLCFR